MIAFSVHKLEYNCSLLSCHLVLALTNSNSRFQQQVQRLHQLTVYSRWLFVVVCWLSLGSFGIWGLRDEFRLWREHLTWAAVRYGLAYNMIPATCLFFCVGVTGAVLTWQSRNILRGLSPQERRSLEKQVKRIQAIGPRHPLWKWVVK